MIGLSALLQGSRVVLVTECSDGRQRRGWRRRRSTSSCGPAISARNTKRITLPKILDALLEMKEEVLVDSAVGLRAKAAVERTSI